MIFIVGGTGTLGQTLVRMLREQGKPVRVLVRPGSVAKAEPLRALGAELIGGDMRDPASLEVGCRGAKVVISATSAGADRREESRRMAEFQGPINLLEAAKAAGVQHYIFTSTLFPKNPVGYRFCWAKLMAEEAIQKSGIPYTIFRPCGLYYEIVQRGEPIVEKFGFFPVVGMTPKRTQMLGMIDVARAYVNAIDNPEALNRTFELGGPQHLTFDEMVAIWSQVLGTKIPVLHLPVWLMNGIGALLKPIQPSAPGIMELLEFSYDEMSCDMRETSRILRLGKMQTLEQYCRDYYATKGK
ncbi:putative NADH-ubiquinone oxidoreductase [Oscillochloris trichoides DG-6]|uniref:NADH-ubiquinone oxidoreductase n=1 Tax=Oscillochloris trichoides DG-6 TaxID=765420 RepID=E1IFA8_9CHLR|nr:SDR family oxidoreductase [Oscillochloris trichoides]EFO80148.1 putative NADH-ubiquinone oxidoreductase [Oscillochloris trichoides DG-6]